jgi:hypothetical protein
LIAILLFACRGREYNWSELSGGAPKAPAFFPLKISANRRYFVDQNGAPFLIHGDAAWSLISGLSNAEAESYLEDRRRKGFNALIVNLIEHKFRGPRDRHGEEPFLVRGDFGTPNEKYFEHADWVIRKAGEKGILVILAPCYLGAAGTNEGWYEEVLANGVEKSAVYARYVANRYKGFDNVIWLLAGDRNPNQVTSHVRAMAAAIHEADGRNLLTAELDRDVSTRDIFPNDAWVDFNSTYTGPLVYQEVLKDYGRAPVMPTILIESYYEGEHGSTPQRIRRQAYWALLSGAAGQVMGNRPVWLFDPGWQKELDSEGNQSMVHLRALFESRPWYEMTPDPNLVSEGSGELGKDNRIAAALAFDGKSAIIYLPTSRTIIVNLSRLSGCQVKAVWFNPRTGQSALAGFFDTSHQIQFDPPGWRDWILLLDSIPDCR